MHFFSSVELHTWYLFILNKSPNKLFYCNGIAFVTAEKWARCMILWWLLRISQLHKQSLVILRPSKNEKKKQIFILVINRKFLLSIGQEIVEDLSKYLVYPTAVKYQSISLVFWPGCCTVGSWHSTKRPAFSSPQW